MRAQKQRRSAERRRRAGLLLQQLQWLRGFPDASVASPAAWRTLRGESIVLDGALLSRSRRAARTALREHPAELVELVGDVDRWWRIVDRQLSWCSEPHGELDLLDHSTLRIARSARDLLRAHPQLRAIVIAASVAWAFAPGELARALAWLAAHPDVAAHELPTALSLLHLSLLHPAGAEALHQLLCLDAPHPTSAVEAVEHLSGWIREQQSNRKQRGKRRQQPVDAEEQARREAARLAKGKSAPKVPRSLSAVTAWLASLLRLEPAAQLRALSLLALAELPAVARTWIDWEAAHASRLARATDFAERGFDLREEWSHYERIRDGLAAVVKAAPSRCWFPDTLGYITELADKPHSLRFIPSILRVLEAQPLSHPPLDVTWRAHVLGHLSRMVSGAEHARLTWFWEDFASALEGGGPLTLLGPWQQSLAASHWCWFDEEMVEAPCTRADVRAAVHALVDLAARGEVTSHDASALRDWMRAGLCQAHAVACVELGRGVSLSRSPSVELRRSLVALVGPSPAELIAALEQASDLLVDSSYLDCLQLAALFTRAASADLSWLMRAALANGHGEALLSISAGLTNLPRTWWPDLRTAPTPSTSSIPSPRSSPSFAAPASKAARRSASVSAVARSSSSSLSARSSSSLSARSSSSLSARSSSSLSARSSSSLSARSSSASRSSPASSAPTVAGSSAPQRSRAPSSASSADDPPAWLARYPAVLSPSLHRLAAVDPDAEATAKRRISPLIPDAADLLSEASALRARAPLAPRLAARLANLEARLASPPMPSARRLARLADKLEQAAISIGLTRLAALTHAEATARLLRTFGLEAWPASWPADRKTVYAVQSLQRLDPADRQLAARLLRARTGPPPWDLRDEPANRRFLDGMRRRGLVLEPWLDDSPTTIQAEGALELSLCSDPLQIFQMGAHFETCLSPGGVNFFSVVSNAADINKRVLYARRAGRVIGRCLFALTNDAGILTFHPYCHESIDFRAIVATFARSLAERMGAALSSSGTVAKLLCTDWYDDGAHDLVGRFSALRDEAQLPLETIDPSAFPARLRELLGRPLDDLSLPTVLELPGLRRRPELILSLSPALLALSVPATRIAAAVLALDVGARELAELLLADHGTTIHPSEHTGGASELLARLRPSLLLTRLRETRERGVRSWRSESPYRLLLAGIALEELKRPRQAIALYQHALTIGGSYYLRDTFNSRLRDLDKHLRD